MVSDRDERSLQIVFEDTECFHVFHVDISSCLMFSLCSVSWHQSFMRFLALSLRPFAKEISQTPRPQSAGLNRWLQRFLLQKQSDKWHNTSIPTTWNQILWFCLFPTRSSHVPCTPHIPLYYPSSKKMKAMNRMQKYRSFVWSKTKSTNHWPQMISEFRFPQRAFKTLPWGSAKLGVSVQWLWLNDKSLPCHWPCSKSVKP